MKQEKVYIYGRHAVLEALRNAPQTVKKVFLAEQNDKEMSALLKKHDIPPAKLGRGEHMGDIEKNATHQGVIALVGLERLVISYEEFVKNLVVTNDTVLVIMGELED